MADADKRTCPKCHEQKSASEFTLRKSGRFDPYCRDCNRAYQREWKNRKYAKMSKHERKAQALRNTYGMSVDDLIDMLLEQDFCCPICTKPLDFEKLNVDHNHDTGSIRGVLDPACNTALGKFGDSVETLQRAQNYLTERGSYGDS